MSIYDFTVRIKFIPTYTGQTYRCVSMVVIYTITVHVVKAIKAIKSCRVGGIKSLLIERPTPLLFFLQTLVRGYF